MWSRVADSHLIISQKYSESNGRGQLRELPLISKNSIKMWIFAKLLNLNILQKNLEMSRNYLALLITSALLHISQIILNEVCAVRFKKYREKSVNTPCDVTSQGGGAKVNYLCDTIVPSLICSSSILPSK